MVKKTLLSNILLQILFTFLTSTIFCGNLLADIHYVSPTGSAAWGQSTSISTPCSPSTAMTNARAGDVVYFRGGTYNVKHSNDTQAPSLSPTNSGTGDSDSQRIIFKAYPSETPVINGASGTYKKCYVMGAQNNHYITFDGFTIQCDGGAYMGEMAFHASSDADHATYMTVKNCIFNGGSNQITSGSNNPGLWVQYHDNFKVQNCYFYSYRTTGSPGDENTGAIILYHNVGMVIINCEIFNCTTAMYVKSDQTDINIAYNYIHNCSRGIHSTPNLSGMESTRVKIYHNVIINNSHSGIDEEDGSKGTTYSDDWQIYNNTLYSTTRGIGCVNNSAGHGWTIYNNIVLLSNTGQLTTKYNGTELKYCDYNQWGTGTLHLITHYYGSSNTYSTLGSWQSSGALANGSNPDVHGLASNPKFMNASGAFNKLSDFRLQVDSPCKGTGKDGVDMGANVDLVGVNPTSLPQIPLTDSVAPASPTGVNVIIIQ